MKNKKILLLISVIIFIIFTVLVMTVDKDFIGKTNKVIGLSSINKLFFQEKINQTWKNISNVFLIISFLMILSIAIFTIFKFLKTKKMEKDSIVYGLHIVLLMFFWILFDKIIIINYRPILIDGSLEGSYPSTHVLLITFVYLASLSYLNKRINKMTLKPLLWGLCIVLLLVAIIARLLSGYHWFTDIIGGVMFGLVMYFSYAYVIDKNKE